MARIVAVHGINNQYSGEASMHAAWTPALHDGVTSAGAAINAADVACVFYGDVFRGPERTLGDGDVPWYTADDVTDGPEQELLQALWNEAARVDPAVVPPHERTLGVRRTAQAALAALASSRFLAGVAERVLIFWLKQVHRYFTEPDIRATLQKRFVDAVGNDTRVVVAHSLGSVVAYEALCEQPDWPVHTLVTLGSPLGIRNLIFDRLRPVRVVTGLAGAPGRGPWPGSVRAWTNIADANDVVALVKDLRPQFGESVRNVEVDTGMRAHDVTRYLTAHATGAAIADGLG